MSDNAAFTASSGTASAYCAVAVSRTGVPEDASGRTSYTVETELQPATRLYWRARSTQGGTTSAWSATATFKTAIVGYEKAGELYDPLTGGTTVGERVGATTFVADKGLRLDTATSSVRYRLPQTVTSGEFSMEVEGLRPNVGATYRNVWLSSRPRPSSIGSALAK